MVVVGCSCCDVLMVFGALVWGCSHLEMNNAKTITNHIAFVLHNLST